MPRDSSGNYTLPIGNPVIDGTVIDTNWANPTMSDIAVQLNNVLTRDGLLSPVSPMYFVDGTPALPGIAFASGHGTGLWKDATQVGISYAGVAKQTWSAAGTSLLGVSGISMNDGAPIAWGDASVYIAGSGATDILYFVSGGLNRARIGTGANLALIGGVSAGATNPALQWMSSDELPRAYINYLVGSPGADTDEFRLFQQYGFKTFYTNGAERMRIDAAGNVGIGTATPPDRLTISDAAGNAILRIQSGLNTAYRGVVFGTTANATAFASILSELNVGELRFTSGFAGFGGLQTFHTNGVERMRIDAAGNVLIGKTAVGFSNTPGGYFTQAGNVVAENGGFCAQYSRLGSDGGIVAFYRQGVAVGDISVSTSGTVYGTISDRRLKNVDGDLTGFGAFIDALRPRQGTWKETGNRFVGFVADELQEVSPGSVVGESYAENDKGEPILQQVAYGSAELIANLVAAVKDLRQRVTSLGG